MANEARTVADLERKYNFAEMLGMVKNLKISTKSIIKVQNELLGFLEVVNDSLENLQDQVDGNITTWFFSGVPTLNNQPASTWEVEEYSTHLGDLYYDTSTGYSYRFALNNNVYSWLKLTDSDVTEALALANAAKDTADGKRRTFYSQPTPPYDSGDLWINNHEIYRCQISKTEEQSYAASDWINDLKYTDDTIANAIVTELGGIATQVLSGQVVLILENYAKFTDLATGGSTIINGANISTGTINTDNVSIGNDNVLIDEDGVKLKNGAKVVGEYGLMNTYLFKSGDRFSTLGYFGGGTTFIPIEKEGLDIELSLPNGLNVTSAKITLYHAPIKWSNSYWGYARNVRLYKATNMYSRQLDGEYAGDYIDLDTASYSEVSGAFGANGYTAPTPTNSSHATDTKESIELKTVFQDGNGNTVPGLYKFRIETATAGSDSWSNQQAAEKTGFAYAMLKIDGYMSY